MNSSKLIPYIFLTTMLFSLSNLYDFYLTEEIIVDFDTQTAFF